MEGRKKGQKRRMNLMDGNKIKEGNKERRQE